MSEVQSQIVEAFENTSTQDSISIIDDAILKLLNGDAGAHWDPMVIEAAQDLYLNDSGEFYRKRAEIKAANAEAQITDWSKVVKNNGNSEESNARSDELVRMLQGSCELFHDDRDNSYAKFQQDDHLETWLLGSEGFAKWASYRAFTELGFSPSPTVFSTAITTLKGIAIHEGEEHQVFLRCAPIDDGYLIDQTNDNWTAIKVTAAGWEVTSQPEKKFIRSNTATALPDPVGGDFSLFWNHVNVPREYRTLVTTFMLESWRPKSPYAILELSGEQGSAKSTTHTRIRQLSDPNRVPLRVAPKDTQDIFVSAANNHQASFENMSNLSGKMQDALCTLSTGGGFSARKLYSDSDESVIEVKRPVIINGISPVATRPDLIDRVIHIDLPKIKNRKTEDNLEQEFDKDLPYILGGLLTVFSNSLAVLPSISIEKLPRMADFALLGEAVHKALDIDQSFNEVLLENRTESLRRSLESSPVAMAIQELLSARGKFDGTIKQLKTTLDEDFHQKGEGWPRSAKGLSEAMKRTAPALREIGIGIEFLGHRRDGSHISILPVFDSENNDHKAHTITDQTKNGEMPDSCDGVTVVTDDSGKSEQPNEDIKDPPDARVVTEL